LEKIDKTSLFQKEKVEKKKNGRPKKKQFDHTRAAAHFFSELFYEKTKTMHSGTHFLLTKKKRSLR